MWCPSATLSVWANAWLAGKAAPDDVLDAVSRWAPTQSVIAYDAVAAGYTGLPWPDVHDAGAMSLLRTLRCAAGRPAMVTPVPGDVRGLPAGTQFERDALAAGEAVIVANPDDPATAVGLVPEFDYHDADDADDEPRALSWTVYALPSEPVLDHHELGEAEYALRSAVRSAAAALGATGAGATGVDADDPRGLVEHLLQTSRQHRVPGHAPSRALRVLENAAHIDAIIAVSAGLSRLPGPPQAGGGTGALWPLAAVVRSARLAAVNAILRSAWPD